MKVLNVKVLAKHNGLKSCGGPRKRTAEALIEVHAGCVMSREINFVCADPVEVWGKQHRDVRYGECITDTTRSKTTSMHVNTMSGSREIPGFSAKAERIVKPQGIRR